MTPITGTSESEYGCPMKVDGAFFDCRWLIGDATLALGKEHEVSLALLSPKLALPLLSVGKKIQMWEGKIIAEGFVKEVHPQVEN